MKNKERFGFKGSKNETDTMNFLYKNLRKPSFESEKADQGRSKMRSNT